jgi:hypothetical protein
MKPEDLTIEQVAEAYGAVPKQWEGRCYAVAVAAHSVLKSGTLAYGHYLGPINKKGFWRSRARLPFIQHGWVILDDGRVLDPTRWSFLHVSPRIWIGPSDEYDWGGQKWRESIQSPPPADDVHNKFIRLSVSVEAVNHINGMLLHSLPFSNRINFPQACWLASGPVWHLGPFAKEFFELLVKKGWGAAIPLDSRQMILGDR